VYRRLREICELNLTVFTRLEIKDPQSNWRTLMSPFKNKSLGMRTLAAIGATIITATMVLVLAAAIPAPAAAAAHPQDRDDSALLTSIGRGRYLVAVTGCNDCHTPGHSQNGGTTPVADWLTGQSVGFQGPWGTSYPANLRLTVQALTESQWLVYARAERRPPMPWFSLRAMTDEDLRAMYRFIRSLGPKGTPAPAAASPGGKVDTPFILFVPQNLAGAAGSRVR
jgi:mono/diheme cytochrome c family protein